MSLVEAAIRKRAVEVGRWTPSAWPAGVSKWVPFLLRRDWEIGTELRTVAAGQNRSFFVDAKGALLACGREEEGEVGLLGLQAGTSQASFTAMVSTPVPSMAGVRIRAVACHSSCNLALREAGHVFAWGGHADRFKLQTWQPRVPTVMEGLRNHRVRQVVAGECHCAALAEDGALLTWALQRNSTLSQKPELGYGRYVGDIGVPRRVLGIENERISSAAFGAGFTVAATEAGAVFSFGFGFGDDRLGHGEGDPAERVSLPKRIEALDGGVLVAAVAVGDSHALALTRCGRVYA
jgi:alpha-tubulin suppressor-like RCC1 family protein